MPSRAAAAAMSSVLREKPKRLSAMSRVKCLAILCRSSTAPTLRPMAAAPRSGWRWRATAAAMRASSRSVAASRSSRRRARSAANAWLRQTIRRSPGKSGEVIAAMSRSSNSDICNAPASRKILIAGARKAVIQSSSAALRSAVMRLGDHAAIPTRQARGLKAADQHHMIKTEAFFGLGHLAGQGHRVSGTAVEDLDRHRTAVRGAQQTVDDLQFAALAVTVVAVLGQRAAAAFHVARRDVVEHQGAAGQVVFGKRRLDRRLADGKPVEGDVELVLIDRAEAELLAETRAGRVRRQRAGGGKLGAGIEQTADDEGQDKIATAVAVRAEQTVETDLARRSEGGDDVPMRQRADDGDRLLVTGDDGATFEQHLEAGDAVRRPVGKVEQGTLFDPAALAVALAQQDGRRRVAIGNRFDIHGNVLTVKKPDMQA